MASSVQDNTLVVRTVVKGKSEIAFWDLSNCYVKKRLKLCGINYSQSCFIGDDYFAILHSKEPLITVFLLISNDSCKNLILPGIGQSLSASPDGNFLLVGINNTIYIWQTCNGDLLEISSVHFKTVTNIIFLNNSHFISISKDPSIFTWNLPKILTRSSNNRIKPLCSIDFINTITSYSLCLEPWVNSYKICVIEENSFSCKIFDLLNGVFQKSVFFTTIPKNCCLNMAHTLIVFLNNTTVAKIKINCDNKEINGDEYIQTDKNFKISGSNILPVRSYWDNSVCFVEENKINIYSYLDFKYNRTININEKIMDLNISNVSIFNISTLTHDSPLIPKPLSLLIHSKDNGERANQLIIKPHYVHTNIKLPNLYKSNMTTNSENTSIVKDDNSISSYYIAMQEELMNKM